MDTTKFKYYEVDTKNSRGMQLFTCRWVPFTTPKAIIFLCHGYAMECSTLMKTCGERLANAGYAVFGIDFEGHGRSGGVRCLITKFDNVVSDCEDFFKSVCDLHKCMGKARFLYGDSMGGSVCLLLHKRNPSFWDGTILVAPMCKLSDKLMRPIPIVTNMLTKFEDIIPNWKIVPTKNIIDSAFKDPAKREAITIPFLVLQGEKDTVTDPEISMALYEQASSADKTIKMYRGMSHGIATGESDENIALVFADIIAWLNDRATKENA